MITATENTQTKLPFLTLILLVSFASVNAMLFTPALPDIGTYFHVENNVKLTMTLFLIGYAVGQLLYGPIANRFGRKPALYTGTLLQIASSLICAFAAHLIPSYSALLCGRFFLALGSGVGLKMTFTLINECYPPSLASQKIAYVMLSFAITPAIATAAGGWINATFGWSGCFYAGALYGFLLLILSANLPETLSQKDFHALDFHHLIQNYGNQFKNVRLISGGFLMGLSTAVIYLFAAEAPFVAIGILKLNSVQYGMANLIPSIGLVLGSLFSAHYSKKYSLSQGIKMGIFFTFIGIHLLLVIMILMDHFYSIPVLAGFFLPIMLIYFGISFILPNASALALHATQDKAHGSAVMNFINVGTATLFVIGITPIQPSLLLIPGIFYVLLILMTITKTKLNKAI